MSNTTVESFLEHHGVKGQHWGVRNKTTKTFKKVTKGSVKTFKKVPRAPSAKTLSDEELAKALKRMNMEQQYSALTNKASKRKAGENFIKDIGKGALKTALTAVATYHISKSFNKTKVLRVPPK